MRAMSYEPLVTAGCMSRSRLEPGLNRFDQRLAQAGVLDALDGFADKRLDEQRFGLWRRNAARAQIEQQVLIEVARRGTVTALHIVGEDFQFRLVVGLGLLR